MNESEHCPYPAKPDTDKQTGKKVTAAFLPDSMEFVTIPFGRSIFQVKKNDVSGLWPKQSFLARFKPVET